MRAVLVVSRVPAQGPPIIWASFLTLLVAGPWLSSGYLFGTDWPGPRRFDYPTTLSSTAPLEFVLALGSSAVSGEVIGKVFVLSLMFVAALIAFRALPAGGFVARSIASTLYLINPFVYGRMHYGQLFLLAGYAVLPWVAVRLRALFLAPGLLNALLAAVSATLIGILSLHLFLVVALFGAVLAITHIIAAEPRLRYVRRLALALTLMVALTFAASAYWVLPALLGRGPEGARIAAIGGGDLNAYGVVSDPHLGLLPNLLGLYGFWAEGTGRFTSMKEFAPLWWAVLVLLLLVATAGAATAIWHGRDRLGRWVSGLVSAGSIAVLLEMGNAQPLTAGLVGWLDAHVPFYFGMRDSGKWAALIALVYSQLMGLGAVAVLEWLAKQVHAGVTKHWVEGIASGVLLASVLYYGNGLLFGLHGEVKLSHYPPGWYAADRALKADSHPGRALFLPWHEYMSFSFVRNQNAVVAPPAPAFFSTPIVVSADPEVDGLKPPTDSDQLAVSDLVHVGDQGQWARVLALHNIKYVLLARELDWRSFDYLQRQVGLITIGDYGTIVLYRNTLAP
jgi:hypothetical protein